MEALITRDAVEGDINFIFNTWLKSYRESPIAKHMRSTVYFAYQHPRIEQILLKSKTLIACNKEDPNHIIGYIVFEPNTPTLHFVYVKHLFRKLGVASNLLKSAFPQMPEMLTYTHQTYATPFLSKKFKETNYIPFEKPNLTERISP